MAVDGINAIVQSNKPHLLGREVDLLILPDNDMVTPETAQVFDHDHADLADSHIIDHPLKARPFKIQPRIPVIHINFIGQKPVFLCVADEHRLLRFDGKALALPLIVL